ncbi:MAG: cation:proton antiporter [Balneolales bacterium]
MADTELVIAIDFAIIIISATILSLIARKTGQPAIVAYLFTGLILGPVFLDVISGSPIIELFSELGLAFLLFLIGFEMNFGNIRGILKSVVNISIYQTILQTALAFLVAYALGFTMMETVIIALCMVFGATPIIVKILADKKETATVAGRINIGVLIIQDIYLVILLAIFNAESLDDPMEILLSVGEVLFLLSLLGIFAIAASRYILPHIFEYTVRQSHAFFAQAIAWGFLFISFTEYLDLSVEIGAFLAGLSLGQLRYSGELKGRVRPITNFFMIIFFSSIGLQVQAEYILVYWQEALISSVALMLGNFLIMFYLIRREKFDMKTTFTGSINMVQVSEFSLVVGALAVSRGFIDEQVLGYFSLIALGTMSVSTYFVYYNNQIYYKYQVFLERLQHHEERDVSLDELKGHAIIVGYDIVSQYVIPLLKEHYNKVVIVDNDPDRVNEAEEDNVFFIFGDFKQEEIRKEAGLKDAVFILNLSRDIRVNEAILNGADEDGIKFLRAVNTDLAFRYYKEGAHYVIIYDIVSREKIAQSLGTYLKSRDKFKKLIAQDIENIKKQASYV